MHVLLSRRVCVIVLLLLLLCMMWLIVCQMFASLSHLLCLSVGGVVVISCGMMK